MKTALKQVKLGHQAPKGWIENVFTSIHLKGDYGYCRTHNFVYHPEQESEKLYNGQPCFYTDARFSNASHNYYKSAHLYWKRRQPISLEACIRRTLNCRNIPIGTIVEFEKDWYHPSKNIDISFLFKIYKENKLEIKYEISKSKFKNNFISCDFSAKLTDALRANGFLVEYFPEEIMSTNEDGTPYIYAECAVAYGYGKKIGISSKNNELFGYYDAKDAIIWDHFGEFDKWSRCSHAIKKTTPIEEIVNILKTTKPDPNE